MANTYDEVLHACYQLYCDDWTKTHLTAEDTKAEMEEWEQATASDDDAAEEYPTFESWLNDNGYGGELYASVGEFSESEFVDADYMEGLLSGQDGTLYTAWKEIFQSRA